MTSKFVDLLMIGVIVIFISSFAREVYLVFKKRIQTPEGNIVNLITIVSSAIILGRFLFAETAIALKDSQISSKTNEITLLNLRAESLTDELSSCRENLNQIRRISTDSTTSSTSDDSKKIKEKIVDQVTQSNPVGKVVQVTEANLENVPGGMDSEFKVVICFQKGQAYTDENFSFGVSYISSLNTLEGTLAINSKSEDFEQVKPGKTWRIGKNSYSIKSINYLKNEFCIEKTKR